MRTSSVTLVIFVAAVVACQGQGTIAFQNSALTRVTLKVGDEDAVPVPVAEPGTALAINYGVFVNGSEVPVLPLGDNSRVAGIITAGLGTAFSIPGVDAGQTAAIQIRGWSASFGTDWRAAESAFNQNVPGIIFGQTAVRNFVLGPISGPGAVIWSGSDPTKLQPLVLVQIVPEPSTIALGVLGLGSLLLFRRRQAK